MEAQRPPDAPYVFISYARVDSERVLAIVATLRVAGVPVWLDQQGIAGGANYGAEIADAIKGAAALVLMCSPASLASRNVKQEVALGWRYERPYVPLLLEPVTIPDDLAYWLEASQWVEVLERRASAWLPQVLAALAPLGIAPESGAREEARLAGRERELALLGEKLVAAKAGTGSLVLIGGEAGIGKTTLAEAALREAAGQGFLLLEGHCFDLAETPPYGPFIDLFARYAPTGNAPPPPDAFAHRGTVGAVPNQMALFIQVQDFLNALTATRPVALLLDDLHWGDPASLDLVRFLARSIATAPLLLLVTYRSDELTRRHPLYVLLPQLARDAGAERLDLGRLDAAAVRSILDGRYGLPETDAGRLTAYLQARAEGNALFVGELLRSLEEGGVLARDGDGWRLGDLDAMAVPALLKQVIDARIARLDEEGRRLLEVAAVIGHAVPYALWATAAEVDEEAVLDLVERAEAARVVEEGRDGAGMRFSHALVREALYEGLASVRRRRLHRRVGEALAEKRTPNPDTVAYHFQRANDPRALPWLIVAGERAQRAYARLTAADRFEAALELLEAQGAETDERGWMLFRLGLLLRYADPRKALTFLESAAQAAAEAGDAFLAACVRCNHGLVHCYMDESSVGVVLIAEAVEALDALPPLDPGVREQVERMGIATDPEHHRGLLSLHLALTGEFRRAQELAERVVARMPPIAATATLDGAFAPDAYRALGLVNAVMGRAEEARAMYARNRAVYRHIGDLMQVRSTLSAELQFTVLPYQTGDIATRQRLAAEIMESGLGSVMATAGRYPAESWAFPLLVLEGRWDEAWRLLRALRGHPFAASLLAQFACAVGADEVAQDLVNDRFPNGPPTAARSEGRFLEAIAVVRVGAALALDTNTLPSAKAWLDAHDRWLDWSGAVLGRSEGQALWAQYYRQLGDTEQAYAHAERALAHATEPRQPLALLAARRLLGELDTNAGRHDDAAMHLAESLALADACAAPYERALTLLAMAELRAAKGEANAARALLDEVTAICTPLGAKPALARADVLAARLAEQPR